MLISRYDIISKDAKLIYFSFFFVFFRNISFRSSWHTWHFLIIVSQLIEFLSIWIVSIVYGQLLNWLLSENRRFYLLCFLVIWWVVNQHESRHFLIGSIMLLIKLSLSLIYRNLLTLWLIILKGLRNHSSILSINLRLSIELILWVIFFHVISLISERFSRWKRK